MKGNPKKKQKKKLLGGTQEVTLKGICIPPLKPHATEHLGRRRRVNPTGMEVPGER